VESFYLARDNPIRFAACGYALHGHFKILF
jgi:hypothetical protein